MSSEKKVSFLPVPSCHLARGFSTSSSRQNTAPFAASPLHTAMSASSNTNSESGSPPEQVTPTRESRSAENSRPRAHSRSSSAPTSLHVPRQRSDATSSRSTSPGLPENRRSVKHLTCFWWKEKGTCRYSEEQCLYAHRDTGRYTDPPRQIMPGEPAKAGRSLDRALKNLALATNKSSSSITSLASSGASTPGLELPMIRATSPTSSTHATNRSETIDNAWLRSMIDQANREKAVFFDTIENLHSDKASLQAEKAALQVALTNIQAEKDQVTQERDVLRGVVGQLQQQQQRNISNPYGVIGGSRGGMRGSWPGPTTSVSRASSHSDTEQEADYNGVVRNLGPTF